jgi:membrane protein DedA with SNARE-associated domain
VIDELLRGLPPLLVYAVVGLLVTAESAFVAGLVLPAATALIALGLLANAGVVEIVPGILVGIVAAWLGGTLAYVSGKRRGPKLRTRHPSRWERTDRFFARHGGRAVFLGQWVVGARTLVPRLAGINALPYGRFARLQTPAAVLWTLWMVGASYLAGASYDVLAARIGHAGGALLTLAVMIAALVVAGRWFGRHPGGWSALGLSMVALIGMATVLVFVVPPVVRFSGLAAADTAVAGWARSQWTSDGYSFALSVATLVHGPHLILAATLVSLGGWWLGRRRGRRDAAGVLLALGPVLPIAVLNLVLRWEGWAAPEAVVFPSSAEFDGALPTEAGHVLAQVAGGSVAQLAAVVGLLAWLLSRRLTGSWRAVLWSAAGTLLVVPAGSWVYLGWSRLSETIAALLLGLTWAAMNAAIWSGRSDRESQVAAQDSEGAELVPVQEPRNPNVVAAPAASRPL